jgi:hypothetical protein
MFFLKAQIMWIRNKCKKINKLSLKRKICKHSLQGLQKFDLFKQIDKSIEKKMSMFTINIHGKDKKLLQNAQQINYTQNVQHKINCLMFNF